MENEDMSADFLASAKMSTNCGGQFRPFDMYVELFRPQNQQHMTKAGSLLQIGLLLPESLLRNLTSLL
jgi:hypothetical protein